NEGKNNLRKGIAPPESSHPEYNVHCDDIDYQIEADYSGIIAPGLPAVPIELGEKFGRLMNYGDGMYAGQFVGAMYSEAYFETNMEKIVEAGLESIPEQSLYAQVIRDVLDWYRADPENWQKTWNQVEEKYYNSYEFQPFASENEKVWLPIDSKINGAYIVMGLLYGKGDIDSTIVISMRCGKDSDCNPSNAAGILFTSIGYQNLPDRFKSELKTNIKFSHTDYDFNKLVKVCEDLTREFLLKYGGRILEEEGSETFYIPKTETKVSGFQASWNPGPFDPDNLYSPEEMAEIRYEPVAPGN
ncbi:MAG: ADP-ribosylglycohydrolase family protein, partial [Bacteroidales bacterium]